MFIYFWILRLAALLGHKKARLLVDGQGRSLAELQEWVLTIGDDRVAWFHAASVGEFEQARPIIERLRTDHPQTKILLTFFSPSGYEMRKNYPGADKVLYLPFATRRNAKKWLRIVPLELVVFAKYEFWPAYLKALKSNHIPTFMISAIFRPKQLFFQPWGGWYRRLLHCFDHIFVQDEASRALLAKYGVHSASVAGDTRFDRVTEVMSTAKDLPIVEGFAQGEPRILVAGSTWPVEEEMLARYVAQRGDVRLILVPHEIHAAHLHQIFQYFEGRYVRYTHATPLTLKKCRTLLVDTMGLLSSIYRYGHVAYIGGGFGAGIHNTLEAAVYGMPVIFGPKWQKFREAKGLLHAGAATSVSNYQELAAALDNAFAMQDSMGQKADAYVKSELGATEKIYNHLSSVLENAPEAL